MADTSNRGLGSDNMDPETKHEIQSEGGQASHGGGRSSDNSGSTGMKGGQASQQGGNSSHQLTEEDRSKGGSNSGGNFANDPERASEAGKIGGSN